MSRSQKSPNSDMEGEFQEDWELLQSSGSSQEDISKSLEKIDDVVVGTQGMITFEYFSLENSSGLRRVEATDERSEDDSVQTGSPGWIEPRSDVAYGLKYTSELWSDSSSDRIEDQRLVDDDLSTEFGIAQETYLEKDRLDSSEEIDLMNSGEGIDTKTGEDSPISGEGKSISVDLTVNSGGGGEERGFVWWKIPIEVLKYCVFRVNPIWSFSMAAAVVGFVMLGRRLYNMKKKSRSLQLKVLLDDKKVTNHTARMNEVISVMKRVPIIRPALPSSVGMNQWSMMRV